MLYHPTLDLAVAVLFICHGIDCIALRAIQSMVTVTKHVLSWDELLPAGGIHAMNNIILTKRRVTLGIDIGVLGNH